MHITLRGVAYPNLLAFFFLCLGPRLLGPLAFLRYIRFCGSLSPIPTEDQVSYGTLPELEKLGQAQDEAPRGWCEREMKRQKSST